MEVNAELVKELRTVRGWTQQHLADACEISLRTVQRVEKEGSTSCETFQELCAVLEIAPSQLSRDGDETQIFSSIFTVRQYQLGLLIATLLGGLLGAVITYVLL